ncbi:MAG: BamA/TamA family outer membrane protein [Candidatus Comchoanobacterales bacterium]
MLLRLVTILISLMMAQSAIAAESPTIIGVDEPEVVDNIQSLYSRNFKHLKSLKPHSKLVIQTTQRAIQAYGYFNSVITFDSELNQVNIKLNNPTIIDHIVLNGDLNDDQRNIIDSLAQEFLQDQKLSIKTLDTFSSNLRTKLLSLGYHDQHTQVNYVITKPFQTQINLTVDPGYIYTIGNIETLGHGLSHEFIQSLLPTLKNTSPNDQTLNNIKQALWYSNLFSEIEVTQVARFDEKTIDILIRYELTDRLKYDFGFGFKQNAFLSSANLFFPRLNQWGHQLTIGSQTLIADTNFEQFKVDANVKYRIVSKYSNTDISFDFYFDQSTTLDDLNRAQLKLAHLINLNPSNQLAAGLNIASITTKPKQSNRFTSFLVIPFLELDSQGNWSNHTHWSSHYGTRFSHKSIGSDISFINGFIDLKTKTNFGLNWVTHWNISQIFSNEALSQLPASIKLTSGGSGHIRGYRYQSIGYGDHRYEASVEAQYPFDNAYVGVFYDTAMVDQSWDGNRSESSGLSAGYQLGDNIISLDIAFPEHNTNNPKLHLNYHATI